MTSRQSNWFVYVLRCADDSLYTGISTDISRRIQEHQGEGTADRGAKYLKGRLPVTLVFQCAAEDRSAASKLEYRIKKLNRQEKEALIRGDWDIGKLVESE